MIVTHPIPGFVSVVGLAVLGLASDGVQFAPGLPFRQIHLVLFLLGKLLVGDEFSMVLPPCSINGWSIVAVWIRTNFFVV